MKDIEKDGLGIVAGSRNHIFNSAEVVRERKWYRNILGLVSNFIVNVICGVKMKVILISCEINSWISFLGHSMRFQAFHQRDRESRVRPNAFGAMGV